MIRYRRLPAVERILEIEKDDPAAALSARNAIMAEFFQSEAAQLIAAILQQITAEALLGVSVGQHVERNVGALSTVARIRQLLVALLPDDSKQQGDELLEGQAEEPFLAYPDSGFDIPYPVNPSGE